MADNYLEKKMDDYRNGRRPMATSASRRRGELSFKFPAGRVLMLGADCEVGRVLIKKYIETGWSVAFTATDETAGKQVAQTCGGRFYPLTLADVVADLGKRREEINVLVAIGSIPTYIPDIAHKILVAHDNVESVEDVVAIVGTDVEQIAMLTLVLSHPKSTIRGQVIRL